MKRARLSDPPARRILLDSQIDDLGAAVLALTREIWVLTDRMTMLEHLLERHGVPVAELDTVQPDAETSALLEAKRERLLRAVLSALKAGDEDS